MDPSPGRQELQRSYTPDVNPWRATMSAFCASLIGIGLARFAYTPLLPAIIGAHWFKPSEAAYLGAANLAGYLAGAILGRLVAKWAQIAITLRLMMVLATAAFFACAYPLSFLWFFTWRFIAGFSGGVLMVLAAPTVIPLVPHSRRGLAGGLIFMGVGVGIAVSGTLVPLLMQHGLRETWIALGLLCCALTAIAWGGWPRMALPVVATAAHRQHPRQTATLRALYIEYALNAAGLVPHMIFLVDFIARGLGQGLRAGAQYWVLFGLGAMIGPLLSGHLADRLGFGRALRLAYLLQFCAVCLPALDLGVMSRIISSIVVGAFTPGIVPLVLGRVHELLPQHPDAQKAAWSKATVSFAVLQASAAYGASYVFARGGDYHVLFVSGSVAILLALTVDLVTGVAFRAGQRQHALQQPKPTRQPAE